MTTNATTGIPTMKYRLRRLRAAVISWTASSGGDAETSRRTGGAVQAPGGNSTGGFGGSASSTIVATMGCCGGVGRGAGVRCSGRRGGGACSAGGVAARCGGAAPRGSAVAGDGGPGWRGEGVTGADGARGCGGALRQSGATGVGGAGCGAAGSLPRPRGGIVRQSDSVAPPGCGSPAARSSGAGSRIILADGRGGRQPAGFWCQGLSGGCSAGALPSVGKRGTISPTEPVV